MQKEASRPPGRSVLPGGEPPDARSHKIFPHHRLRYRLLRRFPRPAPRLRGVTEACFFNGLYYYWSFGFFLCSATPDTGSGLARARSRRRSAHLALDFEAHDGPFEVVRNHAHVGIDSARLAQFDFQLHHEAFARLQPPLARKVAPDEGRRLDLAHDEGRTPLVAQHEAVLEPRAAGLLPEIEVAAFRVADGRTPGPRRRRLRRTDTNMETKRYLCCRKPK